MIPLQEFHSRMKISSTNRSWRRSATTLTEYSRRWRDSPRSSHQLWSTPGERRPSLSGAPTTIWACPVIPLSSKPSGTVSALGDQLTPTAYCLIPKDIGVKTVVLHASSCYLRRVPSLGRASTWRYFPCQPPQPILWLYLVADRIYYGALSVKAHLHKLGVIDDAFCRFRGPKRKL